MTDRYPMRTLKQARESLEALKRDHEKSEIGVMEYRGWRDALQRQIEELEAKK